MRLKCETSAKMSDILSSRRIPTPHLVQLLVQFPGSQSHTSTLPNALCIRLVDAPCDDFTSTQGQHWQYKNPFVELIRINYKTKRQWVVRTSAQIFPHLTRNFLLITVSMSILAKIPKKTGCSCLGIENATKKSP